MCLSHDLLGVTGTIEPGDNTVLLLGVGCGASLTQNLIDFFFFLKVVIAEEYCPKTDSFTLLVCKKLTPPTHRVVVFHLFPVVCRKGCCVVNCQS